MTITYLLAFIGSLWFVNLSYRLQIIFGNYLFRMYPDSWLRKIWWSEYDFYREIDFIRINGRFAGFVQEDIIDKYI